MKVFTFQCYDYANLRPTSRSFDTGITCHWLKGHVFVIDKIIELYVTDLIRSVITEMLKNVNLLILRTTTMNKTEKSRKLKPVSSPVYQKPLYCLNKMAYKV